MFRFLLTFFLTLSLLTQPTLAQEDITLIRDAEIEHYLHDLSAPIFRAAKLNPGNVDLVLIQNQTLNAFVAGGQNIFFFTGLLTTTETPEQLQGVIAHETGHIASGDLIRGTKAMENASRQALLGMIAAALAGLASGRGDVAVGAIGGAQSVAEQAYLSYSREQESAADTAALRFLDMIGQSADGFLSFMKTLAGQEYIPEEQRIAYARTHPLSQERIDNIEHHINTTQGKKKTLPAQLTQQHLRMKAKLLGYLNPETALLRYTDLDPRIEARYARAIALYRKSETPRALTLVDGLLKDEPENPFFHELKGQILFENGHTEQAVQAYQRTIELLPDSALLCSAYAHAMLETNNPNYLDEIIKQLSHAIQKEPDSPQNWRFLATAWHRRYEEKKDDLYKGLVLYARAEESLALAQNEDANRYAEEAAQLLPKKSPYWLRTQDIKMNTDKEKDKDEKETPSKDR